MRKKVRLVNKKITLCDRIVDVKTYKKMVQVVPLPEDNSNTIAKKKRSLQWPDILIPGTKVKDKSVCKIPMNTEGHFMLIGLNFTQKPPIIRNQNPLKTVPYVVRRGKLMKAITMAGIPLAISIVVQVILCFELYEYTETQMKNHVMKIVEDGESNNHMPYLQFCALLLWWITMSGDLYDVGRGCMIICARRFKKKDGSSWVLRIGCCTRAIVFLLCVLSEIAVWGLVLFTGTNFILYSLDIEHLVLNTLAVRFINEVDEIVATATLPLESLKTMEDTEIELRCATRHVKCWNFYSLYLKIMFMALVSMAVTYSQSPYVQKMIQLTQNITSDNSTQIVEIWEHEILLGSCLTFISAFVMLVGLSFFCKKKNM